MKRVADDLTYDIITPATARHLQRPALSDLTQHRDDSFSFYKYDESDVKDKSNSTAAQQR